MEHIQVIFKAEEWSCFRCAYSLKPQGMQQVKEIAKRIGKSTEAVSYAINTLTERGLLSDLDHSVTEMGQIAYRNHNQWWKALLWRLGGLAVPPALKELLADRALCTIDPAGILDIVEKCESGQDIHVCGENYCFFDMGSDMPITEFHDLGTYFAKQANWAVNQELQEELELYLDKDAKEELYAVTYLHGETMYTQKAEENRIVLPVSAMEKFRYPEYEITVGEMIIILKLKGKNISEEPRDRLVKIICIKD